MSKIITTEVNERRHRVIMDRHELKRMICEAVALRLIEEGATTATEVSEPTFTFKVEFRDETEGSPGYKVGVGIIVNVVEDLKPQEACTTDAVGHNKAPKS
ncbi:MAG: hypothetical protein ACTHOP_12630 [Mesorhizobium sp.]